MGYNIHPIFLGMEYFPINVETYQERFGAFILMVLGEAIIMILVPYFDVKVRPPLSAPAPALRVADPHSPEPPSSPSPRIPTRHTPST